jgi:hypothetical protein
LLKKIETRSLEREERNTQLRQLKQEMIRSEKEIKSRQYAYQVMEKEYHQKIVLPQIRQQYEKAEEIKQRSLQNRSSNDIS